MISRSLYGKIVKNRIVWNDPEVCFELLRYFEDQNVEITIKKYRKKRSHAQNRYYWGVVLHLISRETGYTAEEAHEAMRGLFLVVPHDNPKMPPTYRSTSELTTTEFEEYVEKVRRWSAVELGTFIPNPDEVYYDPAPRRERKINQQRKYE